jgi:pimeloyl-ACP methyl ester carboxylesterase
MQLRSLLPNCFLYLILCGSLGCQTTRQNTFYAPSNECHRGVILVADGAGGFQATTEAIRQVVQQDGIPLAVEAVAWSHGYGRIFADQIDYPNARCEGMRLAGRIEEWKRQRPEGEVFLVAHSAGAAVVLAAAEHLPPGMVTRMILLNPAVSADYDLHTSLQVCRDGIDVFYSARDWGYLGLWVSLIGTADRRWAPAAGRTGFQPVTDSPQATIPYAKLRQHPWHSCVAWTGNHGGHYGTYKVEFLRAYVLPLLTWAK